MHAVQDQAGVGQPLLQVGHRGRVLKVEMRPRGEHLDPVEAVCRDFEQVVAAQPVVVVEVRRDAKRARSGHWENYSL